MKVTLPWLGWGILSMGLIGGGVYCNAKTSDNLAASSPKVWQDPDITEQDTKPLQRPDEALQNNIYISVINGKVEIEVQGRRYHYVLDSSNTGEIIIAPNTEAP